MTTPPLRQVLLGEAVGRTALALRAAWRCTDAATTTVQRWAAIAAVAVLTAERRGMGR